MNIKNGQDVRELSEQFPDTRVCGLENSSPVFLESVK